MALYENQFETPGWGKVKYASFILSFNDVPNLAGQNCQQQEQNIFIKPYIWLMHQFQWLHFLVMISLLIFPFF